MKAWKVLPVFSLALLWSVAAFAQDPTKVAAANYKVLFENPSVRILKITYAAGAKSALHSHPEAVVVPLVTSNVKFTGADGKSQERELASETAMFVPAEAHSVENLSKGPIDAILVEFKSKAPGTATLPDTRTNLGMKHIADSPRAVVYRATADTTFHEPAGSKHEFDQVVIALGAAQMSLAIDGKPAKTKWARGEVQFIPRGVAHESKNLGTTPTDFVVVAIK